MDKHRVFKMSFAGVYPHYVQKAERKGCTKKEEDEVICWLTGCSPKGSIRHMDKLVDELAKGRPMEKILRK